MVQAIKRDEVFIEPEGIHLETHQPERRSRKPPLLLVHGALTGSWLWTEFAAYLAERGWEAHAMNLRGHFTSDVGRPGRHVDARLRRRHRRRDAPARAPAGAHRVGDRRARRAHARRAPPACSGSCCWRRRRRPTPCRGVPTSTSCGPCPPVYDAAWWGWTGTYAAATRADAGHGRARARQDAELLDGARESGLARRRADARASRSTRPRSSTCRSLVIGAGLRRRHPPHRGAPHGRPARRDATSTSRRAATSGS